MATSTQTIPVQTRIDYSTMLSARSKAIILVGVLLGLLLAALDQTIVATAMPRIVADLQGLDLLSWVTTAYLLASTAMVPIYGKLSDLYGRKLILIFGIIVFLAGSVLCGIAPTMFMLVIFRGIDLLVCHPARAAGIRDHALHARVAAAPQQRPGAGGGDRLRDLRNIKWPMAFVLRIA